MVGSPSQSGYSEWKTAVLPNTTEYFSSVYVAVCTSLVRLVEVPKIIHMGFDHVGRLSKHGGWLNDIRIVIRRVQNQAGLIYT